MEPRRWEERSNREKVGQMKEARIEEGSEEKKRKCQMHGRKMKKKQGKNEKMNSSTKEQWDLLKK